MNHELQLLAISLAAIPLCFTIHFLYCRLVAKPSTQTLVSRIAASTILILLVIFFTLSDNRDQKIDLYSLIFVLLTSGLATYSYFHWFNMAHTARRIQILINSLQGIDCHTKNTTGLQSNEIISVRIRRLKKLKVLTTNQEGKVVVRPGIILAAALVNQFLRSVFYAKKKF